jgi:hypothetical protein
MKQTSEQPICLRNISGFKEIWVKPSFFQEYPNANGVLSGEKLFYDFPEICRFLHNENGPALVSKHPTHNTMYFIHGMPLVQQITTDNGEQKPFQQEAINEIEHRRAFQQGAKSIIMDE